MAYRRERIRLFLLAVFRPRAGVEGWTRLVARHHGISEAQARALIYKQADPATRRVLDQAKREQEKP